MKTPRLAALFAALTFALAGCNQNATTTTAPAPPPPTPAEPNKDTNIHIQGPRGGKVDVQSDPNGGTNVDVRRGTRR